MVFGMSEMSEILYRSSPEYTKAYEEGYNQAKKEMLDMIKRMQALYDTSTTSSNESLRRKHEQV